MFFIKKQREEIKKIITNIYKFYNMIIQINNDELSKQIFMLSCEKIIKIVPFTIKNLLMKLLIS